MVVKARQVLYQNIAPIVPHPHDHVVDRIVESISKYMTSFNLANSVSYFD
jgi:hypothetical protein